MNGDAAVLRAAAGALCLLSAATGCKRSDANAGTITATVEVAPSGANAEHGEALLQKYECARCHGGLPGAAVKPEKACVGCHENIVVGRFDAPREAIDKWVPLVRELRYTPSLANAGRFRGAWLEAFIAKPHDLRPNLTMTMPRLAMPAEDARDLAAYFKAQPPASDVAAKVAGQTSFVKGDAEHGKSLLSSKGCLVCHRMSGATLLPPLQVPIAIPADELDRAIALAPDLRDARERLTPAMVAAWIEKPSALKSGTDMPDLKIDAADARDLATFIYTAPLAQPEAKSFERLPVLSRPVHFDEVNTKVFHRTCWHCHSEPDFAIGDGGPGNSGGFGFAPRGVDLSSYQGLMAGYFDGVGETRKRKSIVTPTKEGTPRLLAVLLARHSEESGADTGEVRGMPLGLPALSAQDIQLVETWIAQGRQR